MKDQHEPQTERRFTVTNPATGRTVGEYELMGPDRVDQAVARARRAFPVWAETSLEQRGKVLKRAAAILADDAERAAKIIADETGKTVTDALLADVFATCDLLHLYGKKVKKYLKPVKVSAGPMLPGRKAWYKFEPKGVVGVISPWNYPLTLSAGPVASAVAAGDTVVLKPSSQTTACGLLVKEVLERAGLPPGVVEVVTGSGSETGQALVEHPDLDLLFFTGSTGVGKMVNLKAAERLIPAIMELGGKDVAVVTARADLERAARGVVWGSFTNSGQTCIGTETCLVERSVYEPLLKRIVELTEALKNGQASGEVGSMTMASQLRIVEDQVADAVEQGAKVHTGGKRDEAGGGLYYPPTVLTGVTLEMKLMRDETFGPLLPVIPYDTEDEAIRLANSTVFGLSGAVYTRDLDEGRRLAGKIKTGSVCINDCLVAYAVPELPFGGTKESGVGRYHGRMGLQAFCDVKSVTEYGGALGPEPYWYPMIEGADRMMVSALSALYSDRPLRRAAKLLDLGIKGVTAYRKHKKAGENGRG